MKLNINHQSPDYNSFRMARLKSLFNCEDGNHFKLSVDLPVEGMDWKLGLIVGPSGSGKTSLGQSIFSDASYFKGFDWPDDQPIIDAISPHKEMEHITGALSAVGLGSVPAWTRPYKALSNGEKFRADLARILCETPETIVIDEFTSVVDRQIAKIGAGAFAKAWRRQASGQAVLLSCHYDIIEWLQPDWILDTATGKFSGRCLRQRPKIDLDIYETNWRYWPHFETHHYLKLPHMIAATCYVAFVGDEPVAHLAVSTRPGLVEAHACRMVVMPEWQGAGVGMRFLNAVCAAWRRGQNRYNKPMATLFHTSHPALAEALRRSPLWAQVSCNLTGGKASRNVAAKGRYGGHFRAVQGFRYVEGMPS
ncbi:GNAT family N-acetyltransferase [Pseudovibrio sp. WM33]|uniref:GNAT family N-acetyltransferase n=1 Tax=Pseudovibrio sp. WM33 TaxID=1735585 RepID=UPI0007AEE418|nr:GNAT family N-acetyltransferase [Pseudovibrio sp. WM33]KZL19823.1 ABC transporter [Pseudovibrio sp. WM33]